MSPPRVRKHRSEPDTLSAYLRSKGCVIVLELEFVFCFRACVGRVGVDSAERSWVSAADRESNFHFAEMLIFAEMFEVSC